MSEQEPMAEPMLGGDDATPASWADASARLAEAWPHWLATVRLDGRPHVVPVWAVWLDGALYFATGQGTRKGQNLADDPRCVVAYSGGGIDVIVEGNAVRLTDDAKLRRVAALYAARGWPVTVRHGAFDAPYGAPTTGPAPYDVYEVTPATAFGLPTHEEKAFEPTRWRF
jgi:nitroimidazol reductase NimA-like FMN-containing flavoprotein (pyridoxamine 5'-phosphate oxidase superfamily)